MNVNYTNDKFNITVGANWKDAAQYYNMDELIQTSVDGKKRTNDILFYRNQSDKDLGGNITMDYNFNSKNSISYSAEAGYTHLYIDANFKYDETIENQAEHTYVYEDLSMSLLADYFTNNLSYTNSFNESSSWTNSIFYSKINYFMDNKQDRNYTASDFDINGCIDRRIYDSGFSGNRKPGCRKYRIGRRQKGQSFFSPPPAPEKPRRLPDMPLRIPPGSGSHPETQSTGCAEKKICDEQTLQQMP